MNTWRHVLTVGFLMLLVQGQKDPNILSNLDEKVQNYINKVSDNRTLESADKKGHIKHDKAVKNLDQLKKQLGKLSSLKDEKNRSSTSMVDATKKALNNIKRGLSNFFESLKPLKDKGANIALDVHNAIRIATDRILEKLPKT